MMRQQRLKVVEEERDLGVVLRDDLKVSSYCQQTYIKASRMLGLMARMVRFRNLEVMTRLYKSLVRHHLEYCASAWSPVATSCQGWGVVGVSSVHFQSNGAGVERVGL